jgi:hypothetical protein
MGSGLGADDKQMGLADEVAQDAERSLGQQPTQGVAQVFTVGQACRWEISKSFLQLNRHGLQMWTFLIKCKPDG